jgi:hypothetical protein
MRRRGATDVINVAQDENYYVVGDASQDESAPARKAQPDQNGGDED